MATTSLKRHADRRSNRLRYIIDVAEYGCRGTVGIEIVSSATQTDATVWPSFIASATA